MITRRQKKAWIRDLRSGNFKQGQGALCTVNADGSKEYCCLGVLAHQLRAIKNKGTKRVVGISDFGEDLVTVFVHEDEKERRGATSSMDWQFISNKVLDKEEFQEPLSELNDDGEDFNSIADWIEENVPTEG